MTKARRTDMVDLSHYQSDIKIDWPVAKKAGLSMVIHKATEGVGGVDPEYHVRRAEAHAQHVPFGAYHFAHPALCTASAEAQQFLRVATPVPGDVAPVLDLEVNEHNLNEAQLTAWVEDWFAEVFAYTGVQKGLLYTHFPLTRVPKGVRLWVARYNNDNRAPVVPPPFKNYALWQYSNGQVGDPNYVPGVGHVDISERRHSILGRNSVKSLCLPLPPAPSPKKPSSPKKPMPPAVNFLDPSIYPSAATPKQNTTGPQIMWLGQRLVIHGFGRHYQVGPGPNWSESDRLNVEDFQKAQGWSGADADGYPGTETLKRLAADPPKPKPETPIQRLLRIAGSTVGYHEGRSNGHWNNHQKFSPAVPGLEWSQNQPWCATWASYCALKAGLGALYPCTASTDAGAKWFKDRNQWSEYPAVGAQVFYGSNGNMVHTGLVYKYDDTYVYTIEGNTNSNGSAEGDGVYRKKRVRRDPYVQGYGYPAVPGGLQSADPNYHR